MNRLFAILSLLLVTPCAAQQSQPFHLLSAASTNSTNIKPTAGQVIGALCINTTAALYYLKFYDLAAAPTCNSTPVALSIPCSFGASSSGSATPLMPQQPVQFLNGIGICLTGAIADTDNTNAATGVVIDVLYK